MESIEKHIEKDKEILQNPLTSPQQRRHIEGELHDLEEYVEHHKKRLRQEIITIPHHSNSTAIKNQAHQSAKYTIIKYG